MKLWDIFKKSESPKPKPTSSSYADIMISLNHNLEIDLTVYLEDNIKAENFDDNYYAIACAEFLNIVASGKLSDQIIDILNTQIKNENNAHLIDRIVFLFDRMEQQQKTTNKSDKKLFIKPSQVFSKYSV